MFGNKSSDQLHLDLPDASREYLSDLASRLNRQVRVLHVGNIVNNAYKNAKLLQSDYLSCDVLDYGGVFAMNYPEWEDADCFGSFNKFLHAFNPLALEVRGFAPIPWYVSLGQAEGIDYLIERNSGSEDTARDAYNSYLRSLSARQVGLAQPLAPDWRPSSSFADGMKLAVGNTVEYQTETVDFRDQVQRLIGEFGVLFPNRDDQLLFSDYASWAGVYGRITVLFKYYDIVQAYSSLVDTVGLACDRPWVGFETGTLRELPFAPTPQGRRLALGYRKADHVFISNPDVLSYAHRLEIENLSFIPHAIDEKYYSEKFDNPLPTSLKPYVLFPARQSWEIKGNDIGIWAFANVLERHPDLNLVIMGWGDDIDKSMSLVEELGIHDRVHLFDSVPIRSFMGAVQGAEVVMDQFKIGVFGALAPAVMAAGIPLITCVDDEASSWAYERPACFAAHDVESATHALHQALSIDREAYARESVKWMKENYHYSQVVEAHESVYARILKEHEADLIPYNPTS